jgi:DNA polymerase III subunit gamma/tau
MDREAMTLYQALYRTWRPQTFTDMVGQEAIVRTLRNQVAIGRIAHAYLFSGSRGTGKTSAAKIMARAINCLRPVNGDPCGECVSCRTLADNASLDVFEMDAASNSRVEEIRELLEKVDYPPQSGRYKVYIIDEVHMLSNAAFNALLKTLEEPPAYMVFILATTEPQKLPATILSRCQRFDFGRLTEDQIVSRLQKAIPDNGPAEPEALKLIARAAEGSMRDAWSLLDMCLGSGERVTEDQVRNVLGTADKQFHYAFLDAIATKNGTRTLEMIDELMRAGRDVQVFIREFAAHVRQVTAARLHADIQGSGTGEDLLRCRSQAESMDTAQLLRILELFMHAEADSRWASSARAVLEVCALRASSPDDGLDTAALSGRVSELEHEIALLRREGIKSAPIQPQAPIAAEYPAPAQAEKHTPAAPVPADTGENSPKSGKTPKDVWNAMLRRVKSEAPSIAYMLSAGKFGGYAEGLYKIIYDMDNAYNCEFLNEPARRDQIAKWLTEEGGADAKFSALRPQADDSAAQKRMDEETGRLIAVFGRDKVQIDSE